MCNNIHYPHGYNVEKISRLQKDSHVYKMGSFIKREITYHVQTDTMKVRLRARHPLRSESGRQHF